MVAAGACLVLAALLYAVALEPAWRTRVRLTRELPRLHEELVRLEVLREEARQLRELGYGVETGRSLEESARRTLGREGIPAQVRAQGERSVTVGAQGVPAIAWFAWVEAFARESRVRLVNMRVVRAAAPGMVDAEAGFEAPGQAAR